ncbi:MAG: rod shape-determining protein [Bacilli bacterium]|nr:rod shape-determining protein [Bacilli bacterium]
MFSKDIGIDLGTVNILIYIKGEGIVLNEPSVIVIDEDSKNTVAVGKEANDMLGKTPGKLKAIKPMKDGVIANFELVEELLEHFLKKINVGTKINKPRILICCPSNITEVEKNAIKEVAERTGARKVFVEEEPKVAAIGAGLDIGKPEGNMVVDIGGGTTDIAVLSLGNIVTSESIRIAGNTFDQNITDYIKDKYKLLIGEKTAEKIKMTIGSAKQGKTKEKMRVKGRDLVGGLPKTIIVTNDEVEESLKNSIEKIVTAIKQVLEKTPPELSADIIEKGIVLTGGGALINGLTELLTEELKVPIKRADDPLSCVAEGTGIMLDKLNYIDK